MANAAKSETTPFILGVLERVLLAQLLRAQEGNLMETRVIQRFIDELSLSEQEMVEWEWRPDPNNPAVMLWNQDRAIPREFHFTAWRMDKIKRMLADLDQRGRVILQLLPLYAIFQMDPVNAADVELAAEFAALNAASEDKEGSTAGAEE